MFIMKIPYFRYRIFLNEKNQKILLVEIFCGIITIVIFSYIFSVLNFTTFLNLKLITLLTLIVVISLYYQHLVLEKRCRDVQINNYKKRSKIIDPQIKSYILENLEMFEFHKHYLNQNLNLKELSRIFKISEKHLSQVIKNERNSIPSRYINDLKVKHIIELFNTKPHYRLYEYSVLTNEAGFRTNQSLTNAFLKCLGKTPKAYVDSL